MHSHSEPSFGQPDVVVSFDAFKVSKHPGMPMPYEVHPLTPWARGMMTTGAAAVAMTESCGEVIESARGDVLGLKFRRKRDALSFLRDVERAAERWSA